MMEEYEQELKKAVAQARIYSGEWTNMNPSEPGITILENLTAICLLQREEAGQVTEKARLALLALAGYKPYEARPARLLAGLAKEGPVSFPARQKFYAGEICFETEGRICGQQGALQAVYAKREGRFFELRELKKGVPLNVYPFGKQPKDGDCLYLLFTELPQGKKAEVRLYIEVRDHKKRNPFSEEDPIEFAELAWSAKDSLGYRDIPFQDETHGLLQSGEIRLFIDRSQLKKEQAGEKEGYLLRLSIARAEYDRPPEIRAIHGPLFPLIQRETLSYTQWYSGHDAIECMPVFTKEMYLEVYVREEGAQEYVRYLEDAKDRQYERKELADGSISITFPKEPYGYGPSKEEKSVAVVNCGRLMMLHRELGTLLSEDSQSFDVRMLGEAFPGSLLLGARHTDQEGVTRCQFFEPKEAEGIRYTYEEPGHIRIQQAGNFAGWQVFLADYAVCAWERGNIRLGNKLVSTGGKRGILISNPVEGSYGRSRETIGDVQSRFSRELSQPVSAVTAEDYEALTYQVPGLCIHKVSVHYDEAEAEICVTVMPYSNDEFPLLPAVYRRQISRYLMKRSLFYGTVKLKDPHYIKTDVELLLHVRDRERWNAQMVREAIRAELDDRRNTRKIGENLSFESVLKRIRSCPGTGHIMDLSIRPEGCPNIRPGSDIPIPHCAALYPGEIIIREE